MKQTQEPKYASFSLPPALKHKTYNAQLPKHATSYSQDSEHEPQSTTCTNHKSIDLQLTHVINSFLHIAAESGALFSYHVLLKLRAKSYKPPHTPAHLFKRKSLQDMNAHHISFFHKYLQLQQ